MIKIWTPKNYYSVVNLANDKPSAWGDIPHILGSLIEEFGIKTNSALEFGVEFGYSTTALAHYFKKVVGVDLFTGDVHTVFKGDHFEQTRESLIPWKNITLVKSDYVDYIKSHKAHYNLIHVDIVHTYEDTFKCGEWAVTHSDITCFHDTESFPDVRKACSDLAAKYNLDFYNYTGSNGLGILVKK